MTIRCFPEECRLARVVIPLLLSRRRIPRRPAQQTAQQTAPQATSQAPSSKIVLDVVVTSKGGVPAPNLQRQDFSLFDNKTARTISSFPSLSQGQESTKGILVLDAVNTSFKTSADVRPRIESFLRGGRRKVLILK
jgi:hypothetical protein